MTPLNPATALQPPADQKKPMVTPIIDPAPTRFLVLSYPSDRPISRTAQRAGEILTSIMVDHVKRGVWIRQMLSP